MEHSRWVQVWMHSRASVMCSFLSLMSICLVHKYAVLASCGEHDGIRALANCWGRHCALHTCFGHANVPCIALQVSPERINQLIQQHAMDAVIHSDTLQGMTQLTSAHTYELCAGLMEYRICGYELRRSSADNSTTVGPRRAGHASRNPRAGCACAPVRTARA